MYVNSKEIDIQFNFKIIRKVLLLKTGLPVNQITIRNSIQQQLYISETCISTLQTHTHNTEKNNFMNMKELSNEKSYTKVR